MLSGAHSVTVEYWLHVEYMVIAVLHVAYVVIHVFQLRNMAYASMGMLSEVLSVEVLNDDIHIIISRFHIAVYILLVLK